MRKLGGICFGQKFFGGKMRVLGGGDFSLAAGEGSLLLLDREEIFLLDCAGCDHEWYGC